MEPARYGRLVVLGSAPHVGDRPAFLCRCDCGQEVAVQRKKLRTGHTQSCGCLQRQRATENMGIGQQKTHGLTGSREYRAWSAMKARVSCVSAKSSARYVGRIGVCLRWQDSFEDFLQDVGPAPEGIYSIDRIDNDGDYEPGNVHWATDTQQNRNKSDNVMVFWRGREMTLAEAAETSEVPYQTIWHRIQRAGWSADRALSAPVRGR